MNLSNAALQYQIDSPMFCIDFIIHLKSWFKLVGFEK
jgi:hypothetical protein